LQEITLNAANRSSRGKKFFICKSVFVLLKINRMLLPGKLINAMGMQN